MKKKRHTPEEIATKLRQAEEMTAQGKRQGDIARTLGVSMMTYHRWRKATSPRLSESVTADRAISHHPRADTEDSRIRDLQVENSQLRRLVTDLLLEKMKLEEVLKTRSR